VQATAPAPIAPIAARRGVRPDENMTGSFFRLSSWAFHLNGAALGTLSTLAPAPAALLGPKVTTTAANRHHIVAMLPHPAGWWWCASGDHRTDALEIPMRPGRT